MRVLLLVLSCFIIITPSAAIAQVEDVSSADLYAGGPAAPVILSTDMPSPDTWYRPEDASFHWGLPSEVVAVAIGLFRESGQEPMESYRPPVTSIDIAREEWQDGEQYVVVQFKNADKWGMFAERKVMIDGTPPAPFVINVSNSGGDSPQAFVSFTATDDSSGVAYYDVETNGYSSRITAGEAGRGFYVSLSEGEDMEMTVTAHDQAGNTREASTTIHPIVIEPTIENLGFAGFVTREPASILAALMGGLLLVIFGYMVYERQRYAAAVGALKEESDEAQTQIMRIFNALRSEIYDQINAIDGKTRLSKKEKEAVSGLTKALKTSEKLLKKEVKDIRKLL